MEDSLHLYTKNVYFLLYGETYQQLDGVAIGSLLGPIFAGILMVELENTLVPTLNDLLLFWKRYVDDTLCFVKRGYKKPVVSALNDFHVNITLFLTYF